MTRATTNLGGTASSVVVGKVAVSQDLLTQFRFVLRSFVLAWTDADDVSSEYCNSHVTYLIKVVPDGKKYPFPTNSVLNQ